MTQGAWTDLYALGSVDRVRDQRPHAAAGRGALPRRQAPAARDVRVEGALWRRVPARDRSECLAVLPQDRPQSVARAAGACWRRHRTRARGRHRSAAVASPRARGQRQRRPFRSVDVVTSHLRRHRTPRRKIAASTASRSPSRMAMIAMGRGLAGAYSLVRGRRGGVVHDLATARRSWKRRGITVRGSLAQVRGCDTAARTETPKKSPSPPARRHRRPRQRRSNSEPVPASAGADSHCPACPKP